MREPASGNERDRARERRFFATKAHAQTHINQTRMRVLNSGTATHGLTAGLREAAASAFRLLHGEEPSDAFLSAQASRNAAYKRQVHRPQGTRI